MGNISFAKMGSTLCFQCGLSCGSAREGVASPMNRCTPSVSIACTMRRVPSASGVPVAERFRDGPRALTTASAPVMACSTQASSDNWPLMSVSWGWAKVSLPGLRVRAVTWWPASRSCWTTRRPMPPVGPKTVMRIEDLLVVQ
ncbi:hypothetical protein BIV57_04310 [Mangrovactinospora gilvigrisea]|uniref:Uncharacterized protein n=1 Tax=Mangrovactinospora gilvigrisea TaxID=1428644 RepID=A0A1J7CGC5_9ACTN|nr:hypothetical protein BIV57_04310 [Mangrovactinospora gilvigrisea]